MSQAAFPLPPTRDLAALLTREFESENLALELAGSPALPQRLWQRALCGPLCEMASRPGKELRAQLVEAGWRMAGGGGELPAELPAIVEALHLGSLIVDDIEDDSARRRGGVALHRAIGVPLALNAGNWLYFLPGALLGRLALPPMNELLLRRDIDRAVRLCHYGQALDLSVSVTELRQRDVASVVLATTRLKTGSLTELAIRLGASAAGAAPEKVGILGRFGSDFGVALQMLDDLGGLVSEKRSHKGHEDLLQARPTWPWAWLAEQADAVAYLRLRALGDSVVARELHPEHLAEQLRGLLAESGLATVRAKLLAAREAVRSSLGDVPGSSLLDEAADCLEHLYG
ncbi:MAG TPA: polyprenyl synthetase family protein [Polyangiaceae bacterium]|nr:polyprenyl synthetase family protein [Polyangiaceae bacterium]